MPNAKPLRVTSRGQQTTITFLDGHLNQMGVATYSNHLEELSPIEPCSDSCVRLNLDLQRVERISSAGLNELIGINSLARSRGVRLVLLDVQDSVREIFALTRLERMFEFDCSSPRADGFKTA